MITKVLRGVRNCILQTNFMGDISIDCIGTSRTPTKFDFKIPGDGEINLLKQEKNIIQGMIQRKSGKS